MTHYSFCIPNYVDEFPTDTPRECIRGVLSVCVALAGAQTHSGQADASAGCGQVAGSQCVLVGMAGRLSGWLTCRRVGGWLAGGKEGAWS